MEKLVLMMRIGILKDMSKDLMLLGLGTLVVILILNVPLLHAILITLGINFCVDFLQKSYKLVTIRKEIEKLNITFVDSMDQLKTEIKKDEES